MGLLNLMSGLWLSKCTMYYANMEGVGWMLCFGAFLKFILELENWKTLYRYYNCAHDPIPGSSSVTDQIYWVALYTHMPIQTFDCDLEQVT